MDGRISVIVVDNSYHARHGLCAALAAQPGMDIVGEASQGLESLALVEAKKPEVVLMDVRMPVMDGLQAALFAIKEGLTPPEENGSNH